MIRSLRRLTVATAALVVASAASAAQYNYEFKTFNDPSTLNPFDTKTLDSSIANLVVKDITGGVQLTLKFNDTSFPAASSGLFIDELWLKGSKGTLSKVSGTALDSDSGYYTYGFLAEGGLYNWDIEFASGAFKEGLTTTLTIKGNGVDAGDFAGGAGLEIGGIGKPYTGFLGLNKNVRFVGNLVAVPEPGTYALMGLGLAGIALAARRQKRQG